MKERKMADSLYGNKKKVAEKKDGCIENYEAEN